MKTAKEVYKSLSAWFGIVDEDDEPKFLYSADDLRQALRNDDLADEIGMHFEVSAAQCSCSLELEYSGMPVDAQSGHRLYGKPTSILLFENADGFKLQCQDCLYDWPVFDLHCEHGSRTEAAHCRYCLQAIVRQAAKKGCKGHSDAAKAEGPLKKIFELSNPGFMIYLGVCVALLLTVTLDGLNIVRIDLSSIPKLWQIMVFLGAAFWALGYYFAESNPELTSKLKSRAVGSWLWGVYSIFSTAAIDEFDQLVAQISAALGLG